MAWIQVYIKGLSRSTDPSNEVIENLLNARYNLIDDAILWAGPDTTLVKRDEKGSCRGYAFLAFYSAEGAAIVADRINNGHNSNSSDIVGGLIPLQLRAELSNPKAAKERKKVKGGQNDESKNVHDLRLRRQRKPPIRKHPVIISSDRIKTNLGNKTK
jgi:hypothetical protein